PAYFFSMPFSVLPLLPGGTLDNGTATDGTIQKDLADRLIAALKQDGFVLYAQPILALVPDPKKPPFQETLTRFREEADKLLPPPRGVRPAAVPGPLGGQPPGGLDQGPARRQVGLAHAGLHCGPLGRHALRRQLLQVRDQAHRERGTPPGDLPFRGVLGHGPA